MTWPEPEHLQAAGAMFVAAGAAGWFTPHLIQAVPEPRPEPEEEAEPGQSDDEAHPEQPKEPKELYADIAALPGLAIRAALASALVAAAIGLQSGWSWELLVAVPVVPVCVALSVIDWRTRLLPTRIVVPATLAALALGGVHALVTGETESLVRGLIGLVVTRSLFWVLWFIRSAGMGFGDVRLAALLGFVLAFLGWPELVVGVYAGFLVFGLPGLCIAIARRDRSMLKAAFPFGPSMVIGALLGILAGPWLAAHLVG